MEEWVTVLFSEVPDLNTRKTILDWVETSVAGRFLHVNVTDFLGRRRFGFQFQRPEDAALFESRWIQETIA